MKLSRTVTYGVQALLTLAEIGGDQPVPCSRLAAIGQLPERFLLQILRTLVEQGILVSTRGVEGGYRLSRPATQISLLQIIEAIEGPLIGKLETDDTIHNRYRGRLGSVLDRIATQIRRELDDASLAYLIGGEK